jgi:hypothetical protein
MKFIKFKKIVFLVFGNNHRYSTLGNFGKSKIYKDILLISLGGRFKSIIGRFLYLFGIGKFIGVDANPFFKNEKNSINIWFNGTQKIHIKELENHITNYFNMSIPIINEKPKIFKIYPLIYKKKNFYSKPKIIFMGKIYYPPSDQLLSSNFLSLNKEKILKKFDLIDDKSFWSEVNDIQKINLLYKKYRIMKTYLRQQVILEIKKNFKDNLIIYGQDRINTGINFHNSIYKPSLIKKIYEGNICIDTGSAMGSLSLHPRSLTILESNGLLMQSKQVDSSNIWGDLNEKIVFNNIESFLNGIDLMLTDQNKFNEYLDAIYEKFKKSEHKTYEVLKENLKL